MKALILQHAGPAPVMAIEERAKPTPGKGCSLVRVHAATANPLSHLIRTAVVGVARLPLVLSNDGAGTVEQSERFATGTRVVIYGGAELGITRDGLQQQWIAVPDKHLVELPAALSLDQGAALPINYVTAFQAMNRTSQVKPGDNVLISGASGSVGQALIQIARALGATPIAVVSSAQKIERATTAGADLVIDLSASDLREQVLAVTHGIGADVAFDTVGGPLTGALLGAVKIRGQVVSIGFVGGITAAIDISDVVIYEKKLVGYDAHLETDEDVAEALRRIIAFVAEGRFAPHIDSHYPLEDYQQAYARLNSRRATGAILLHP